VAARFVDRSAAVRGLEACAIAQRFTWAQDQPLAFTRVAADFGHLGRLLAGLQLAHPRAATVAPNSADRRSCAPAAAPSSASSRPGAVIALALAGWRWRERSSRALAPATPARTTLALACDCRLRRMEPRLLLRARPRVEQRRIGRHRARHHRALVHPVARF